MERFTGLSDEQVRLYELRIEGIIRVQLQMVMDRIAAILTEVGSPTDHMSILAREFRVPTLVEVGEAPVHQSLRRCISRSI